VLRHAAARRAAHGMLNGSSKIGGGRGDAASGPARSVSDQPPGLADIAPASQLANAWRMSDGWPANVVEGRSGGTRTCRRCATPRVRPERLTDEVEPSGRFVANEEVMSKLSYLSWQSNG
jgi:hypothetical protein